MLAGRAFGPQAADRLGTEEHSDADVAVSATTQARPESAVDDNVVARQKIAPNIAPNGMAERVRIANKVVVRNIAISRNDSRRTAFVGSSNRHIEPRWAGRLRHIDLINTSRSFHGALYRKPLGNPLLVNPGGSRLFGFLRGLGERPTAGRCLRLVAQEKFHCRRRGLH
jgi:hypothetical protein